MARWRDEDWPYTVLSIIRMLQVTLAVVNPVLATRGFHGAIFLFAFMYTLGVVTAAYAIASLTCYYRGTRLHPLSVVCIDFGATFLWLYGAVTIAYWRTDVARGVGAWWQLVVALALLELFLFAVTTGIAAAVVRREKMGKVLAGAGTAVGVVVVPQVVVPGKVV
ncbi:hypothetical protein DFP73DRAFT_546534 [Morchella snyderi]|nr:hypothetical protein DFP73DRAFT_546534 [Morchella snyderi]